MLHIQYIPHQKLESLNNKERVELLMRFLRNGKILIIDGRIRSSDEALLIRETMSSIGEDFNGVEIGVMYSQEKRGLLEDIKHRLAGMLIGDRHGITLIGPARIIKELRQYPEHLELHLDKMYLNKRYHGKPHKERDQG